MSKKKNGLSELEELYQFGIIKDKRRRLILVIPNKQEGYHLQAGDMTKVRLLDGQYIWAALLFVLGIGLLKLPLIAVTVFAVAVIVGFEVFKRFVFLKDKQIIKISDTDYAKLESEEALRALKSDRFMDFILPIFVALVLISRQFEVGGYQGIEATVFSFLIALSAGFFAYNFFNWLKILKKLKAFKRK
ncbi:hypothetical protein [Erysipelothrix aquatica]|uniref:hypothetical protein n=1 Tax=Erysipelothrix aquatica TaxID=2683714 RepID=UPI001356F623|nr:hypothetical protein [Erysipelothrix aquatica]